MGRANVSFRVATGHDLSFAPDGSIDLVTIAQALHFFDPPQLYAECKRVLRKGGVLAAFGYDYPTIANKEANVIVEQVTGTGLRFCLCEGVLLRIS